MKIFVNLFILVFASNCLLSQSIKNLTSADKSSLFQGIIYSKRNMCSEANNLLITFVNTYNGSDKDYWLGKAKSYILPCDKKINSYRPLKYFYRPYFDKKENHKSSHSEKELVVYPAAIYIQDAYFQKFSLIKSLSPESFYPLIEVDILENQNTEEILSNASLIENEDFVVADTLYLKDAFRLKFNIIRSLSPESFYPLINQENFTNNVKVVNDPNPNPNQKPPSASKPMPDVVTKTDKNPITPKPDQNQNPSPAVKIQPVADIAPKTNSQPEEKIDITVSEKKHHYKILFSIENQPDKSFVSLSGIGPVTYEKANGENYIYYIGFFQSEEKAIDAREKVKASGYKMARVMEFNKGALEKEFKEEMEQPTITEVLDKKTNTESKPVELQETPAPKAEESKQLEKPKEQIQEVIKSDVVSYHILFRVLDNPYEKFDNLKQFGPLYRETFDAKGSSRYLIGNTDDINVAKQLLEKVKKAGYPASFISEYINGSLSKIIQE